MTIPSQATVANAREQRGIELAKVARIKKRPAGTWIVPSATDKGSYIVETARNSPSTCSCPDFELRGAKCKHIFAVEYASRSETLSDGTVKTVTTKRVTYTQEWTSYNLGQTTEKARVAELLRELCDGVGQPPQTKGRPRLAFGDMVFAATMKVFGTMSARRSNSDMEEYAAKGYLAKAPHFNSVLGYLEDPALTPILTALIEESAAPLVAIESDFAVDSSGFSTCQYVRWFDEKYGKPRAEREWIKAHLMTGVRTHVVTSVQITDKDHHDSPLLPSLLATTTKRFTPRDVLADKGYLSQENASAIVAAGATPYIPFRVNSTGTGSKRVPGRDRELWSKLFGFFTYQRTEFLAHCNARSNVESAFSMIKRKYGAALRAKSETGQRNELLCKVLCHNLSVLVAAIYELGITPIFWAEAADAQESAGN